MHSRPGLHPVELPQTASGPPHVPDGEQWTSGCLHWLSNVHGPPGGPHVPLKHSAPPGQSVLSVQGSAHAPPLQTRPPVQSAVTAHTAPTPFTQTPNALQVPGVPAEVVHAVPGKGSWKTPCAGSHVSVVQGLSSSRGMFLPEPQTPLKSTVQTPPCEKMTKPSELALLPSGMQAPPQRACEVPKIRYWDPGAPWAEQFVEHTKGAVVMLPVPRMRTVVVTFAGVLEPRVALKSW
jgi:hypothetical protein